MIEYEEICWRRRGARLLSSVVIFVSGNIENVVGRD